MWEIDSLKAVRGEEGKAHLDLLLLADGRSLPLLASGSLVKGKIRFGHNTKCRTFQNSSNIRLLFLRRFKIIKINMGIKLLTFALRILIEWSI